MVLHLKRAGIIDLDLLTEMNKQLIEDEGSSNPMNFSELKERMSNWLQDSWHAELVMDNEEIIGYALYCLKENQYDKSRKEVYLRQYFVRREHRKQGNGLKGIELLKEKRFKGIESIEIDVLESNEIGKNFWIKAGFKPYVSNMRMKI